MQLKMPSPMVADENLRLRIWMNVVLGFASIWLSFCIYTNVQNWAQRHLFDALHNADVLAAYCRGKPAFDPIACGRSTALSEQVTYALLVDAGVIRRNEYASPEDLFSGSCPPHLERLIKHLRGDDSAPAVSQGQADGRRCGSPAIRERTVTGTTSTADTTGPSGVLRIVRLSGAQCLSSRTGDENERGRVEKQTASWLAFFLADLAGGDEGVLINNGRCGIARDELTQRLLGAISTDAAGPVPGPISGLRFDTSKCLGDMEILNALALRSQSATSLPAVLGYSLPNGGASQACPVAQDRRVGAGDQFLHHEAFMSVQEYLVGVLRTAEEVRQAQRVANLVRGYEHIGLIGLGIFFLLASAIRLGVFAARFCSRLMPWTKSRSPATTTAGAALPNLSEQVAKDLKAGGDVAAARLDAISRGRAYLRWAIATVPALGFIGTVRGILNSLSQAGDIVWASSRVERADAIGSLAGDLGLAFSTTLLALLIGVLLGLVSAISRNFETTRLDRVVLK